MCYGYKAVRPNVTWTVKVYAFYEYEALGVPIYIDTIDCLYSCYLMKI